MKSNAPMYLEDLTVGMIFQTESVRVDPAEVQAFASAYDPQPFHLDEKAASATIFGGLVASGWHTAALTMRLIVTSDFKIAGGLVGAGVDVIRWPRPVYPGDTLRAECEVLAIRPSQSKPDRGIVRTRMTTRNQHGDVVMEQTANLIVPRVPAPKANTSQSHE